MRFLIDAPKREANLVKLRLDLAEAARFDWRSARVADARLGREKAIGRLGEDVVVVIFKQLGTEAVSVISLRPASRKERTLYGTR